MSQVHTCIEFAIEPRNRFSRRRPIIVDLSARPDRAKQSMKDQCDINFIMGRYLKSGNVDWLSRHAGAYGEVPSQSFQECMNIVAKAKEMFADLPSEVRKRFSQSPMEFMDFMHDGKNLPEMRRLGLAKPEPAPAAVPPAPPSSPSSGAIAAPAAAGTVAS